MRSSAESFCDKLRDGLKNQLQLGQMKSMKTFAKTLYSEALCNSETNGASEGTDAVLVDIDPRLRADGDETEEAGEYLRGLGCEFKFPGDPKKWVIYWRVRH